MKNKADIEKAIKMGQDAFNNGLRAAPVLNSDFHNFLHREGSNHKRLIKEMDAYIGAWNALNLYGPKEWVEAK